MHDKLKTKKVGRRTFLQVSAVAGGGILIGLYAPKAAGQQAGRGGGPGANPATFAPNAYITVNPNNTFTIVAKNPETGQGIKTALPQIIADEFDVDWTQVSITQADLDPKYSPQTEGGSRAIPVNYQNMRLVGAGGRLLMLNTAAAEWNVPVGQLTTGSGTVKHAASNRTATYASLAARALTQPTPDRAAVEAVLKNPRDFKIIGKRIRGVDNLAIVTGKARYSIDQAPPGMLFAVYEKCPVFGGKATAANLDEMKKLPGVKHAFLIAEPAGQGNNSLSSGVAIVADSWWIANDARRTLKVTWNEGATATESTAGYQQQCKDIATKIAATPPVPPAPAAPGGPPAPGGAFIGDVEAAFKTAAKIVEAEYYFPLLSHAPLEPQNSTALFKDGRLEIWSPSQIPSLNHPALGAGIPATNITMHLVQAGGGFGRRLVSEYDIEVARIAKLVTDERVAAGQPAVPVKLLWTREDDMAHDQYRPAGTHFFKAGLDAAGKLVAYRDIVGSTNSVVPANEFPRGFVDNVLVMAEQVRPFSIPVGALRAPPTNGVSFVMQGFIDELAVAAGQDPIQFRIDLLNSPKGAGPTGGFNPVRARGVLEAVRDMSGWNTRRASLPRGTGLGVAFQYAHAGYVAYVVELTVDGNKAVKINRVWSAVDIGRQIVNPSMSENLVHGGFIEGMSHIMNWEVTIERGRVVQTNFHQYQPTRMAQAPATIEVKFLETDFDPTGLGEPSLPPAVPAITNAIFAATGQRIRSTPLSKHGYRWA